MGPCRGSIALTCFDLRHPKTIATLKSSLAGHRFATSVPIPGVFSMRPVSQMHPDAP